MILLDQDLHELGNVDVDFDVEIGDSDASNDFMFSTQAVETLGPFHAWYIEGTEYGGVIEYDQSASDVDYQIMKGYTWRGLLAQDIIMPPSGSDYKIVSGDANTIIGDILQNVLGGFFVASSTSSGLTLSNYQFPLYINVLDGLELMLEEYDYRLKISCTKDGETIKVQVEAVEAVQVEGTMNSDNRIPMTFTRNRMGINHLICGGSGELQDRLIVDLYIDDDGNVSQTPFYTGFDERTAFFDYGNAQSEEDLIDKGTEKLKSICNSNILEMEAPENMDLEIGDKVKGQFPDGTVIISPITRKIYKITDGLESVEYKIKGDF